MPIKFFTNSFRFLFPIYTIEKTNIFFHKVFTLQVPFIVPFCNLKAAFCTKHEWLTVDKKEKKKAQQKWEDEMVTFQFLKVKYEHCSWFHKLRAEW